MAYFPPGTSAGLIEGVPHIWQSYLCGPTAMGTRLEESSLLSSWITVVMVLQGVQLWWAALLCGHRAPGGLPWRSGLQETQRSGSIRRFGRLSPLWLVSALH